MADEEALPFIPPPECPVYHPDKEEWRDPLAFLEKVRPEAEQCGICKIIPPPDWQPPFVIDVDKFRFTPRIQRLNELEATSRVKMNFLDKIAKFWDLQGLPLTLPTVEGKVLDLYKLHKCVKEIGGLEKITSEKKWHCVASRMGYTPSRGVATTLRHHYEKILYPFDMTAEGEATSPKNSKPASPETKKLDAVFARRVKRAVRNLEDDVKVDYSANRELKRLQFFGPGPKAAILSSEPSELDLNLLTSFDNRLPVSHPDRFACKTCRGHEDDKHLLLCDNCDDCYHTYCLVPPLEVVPMNKWKCARCILAECDTPREVGFPDAGKSYSLQSFGEMADTFKSEYFNMPVHLVPCETTEEEFWRLTRDINESITVEYGADISALEKGSGFPTKDCHDLYPDDVEYCFSPWNLNNLSVLDGSVLKHINADISGMKVPWLYVGMCFAAFCWHNEDHWSYSVNYLHWGEPKTWYGVPGPQAEIFEEAMLDQVPELFESQPDLLHQLVTIMHPNLLMKKGVPIVRTDQRAGEFVVTFPRAYHAGFNQGYNCAEAVNVCPADWIKWGRMAIDSYQLYHRFNVFSHNELICKLALEAETLNIKLASATFQDMLQMVEIEKRLRKELLEKGVLSAEREAFELLPDDERQCAHCRTTCFLSAVACTCKSDKLVCLHHVDKLCSCVKTNYSLKYRYTLDELPSMLRKIKARSEPFDRWILKAKAALHLKNENKLELTKMKALLDEAVENQYPENNLIMALKSGVSDAEKCAHAVQQLISRKVRTRSKQVDETGHPLDKLSLEELQLLHEEMTVLLCRIPETDLLKDFLNRVKNFQAEVKHMLATEMPEHDKLQELLELGQSFELNLGEIPQLKQCVQQAQWLEKVQSTLSDKGNVMVDDLKKYIEMGVNMMPHPLIEKTVGELQGLLMMSERWEEKAQICLQAKPRHALTTIEAIIHESEDIPVYLPNISTLKDAVRKAKDWSLKIELLQNSEHYPYLEVLECLVSKGRSVPVRLDQLPQIESQVAAAKSWRERTARTFLKKNSSHSLLDVLSPKADIGVDTNSKRQKRRMRDEKEKTEHFGSLDISVEDTRDPAAIVAAYKAAETTEIESMRNYRKKNCKKALEDKGEAKYCVCRKRRSGFMLQCELCEDWFHSSCVPLPKAGMPKNKTSAAAAMQAIKDLKFLCPHCLTSRRPRLETILSLLVSLQKLPVRLPEGEALQCLTERAMGWQDRARQALATGELASALAKLSVLSQKMVEQAAREKTEKIITAELQKAANNPELQSHLTTVAPNAFSAGGDTDQNTNIGFSVAGEVVVESECFPPLLSEMHLPESESQPRTKSFTTGPVQSNVQPSSFGGGEHAYSSASKTLSTSSPRKHSRKSPIVPRQFETPVLELTSTARLQLEDLMMEGDLLEVSLDETQHIWRILQACKVKEEPKYMEFVDQETSSEIKVEKEKNKKKIKLEPSELRGRKRKLKDEAKKIQKKDVGRKKLKTMKMAPTNTKEKALAKVKSEPVAKDDDKDDDPDNICAATPCYRPMGEAVDWVQCDGGCELWFHYNCVGLSEDDLNEDEDYICLNCSQKEKPVGPIGTTDLVDTEDVIVSVVSTPVDHSPSEFFTTTTNSDAPEKTNFSDLEKETCENVDVLSTVKVKYTAQSLCQTPEKTLEPSGEQNQPEGVQKAQDERQQRIEEKEQGVELQQKVERKQEENSRQEEFLQQKLEEKQEVSIKVEHAKKSQQYIEQTEEQVDMKMECAEELQEEVIQKLERQQKVEEVKEAQEEIRDKVKQSDDVTRDGEQEKEIQKEVHHAKETQLKLKQEMDMIEKTEQQEEKGQNLEPIEETGHVFEKKKEIEHMIEHQNHKEEVKQRQSIQQEEEQKNEVLIENNATDRQEEKVERTSEWAGLEMLASQIQHHAERASIERRRSSSDDEGTFESLEHVREQAMSDSSSHSRSPNSKRNLFEELSESEFTL